MRQGPHQGAQKSTSTGSSLRPIWVWNAAASSAMDRPLSSSDLQRGHLGCSLRRAAGVRTTAWHDGQATRIESVWGSGLFEGIGWLWFTNLRWDAGG